VGAGIGYHEVVAGHTTAGELRRLVEKLVPGDGANSYSLGNSLCPGAVTRSRGRDDLAKSGEVDIDVARPVAGTRHRDARRIAA
jgi:hypothetical protein